MKNPSSADQARLGGPHVLTLTPFYPTERDDASGCFVSEPLAALESLGITHTVFAVEPVYRSRSRPNVAAPAARWIRYLAIPSGFGLSSAGAFLYARIVSLVRELHGQRRVDVIHAHAPLPCGHAAMLLHGELGIPYVVTVHGLDAFSTVQVSGRAGNWRRRISQHVYRNATRVICISEMVREEVLKGTGGDCRTTVVYNGVDTEMFTPALSPPDPITILSVGNLISIKGHDVLLRAAGSLAAEFPSLRWEIIGDGPERGRLQTLANELGIADRVHFPGAIARSGGRGDAALRRVCFAEPLRRSGMCVSGSDELWKAHHRMPRAGNCRSYSARAEWLTRRAE